MDGSVIKEFFVFRFCIHYSQILLSLLLEINNNHSLYRLIIKNYTRRNEKLDLKWEMELIKQYLILFGRKIKWQEVTSESRRTLTNYIVRKIIIMLYQVCNLPLLKLNVAERDHSFIFAMPFVGTGCAELVYSNECLLRLSLVFNWSLKIRDATSSYGVNFVDVLKKKI